MASGSIRSRSRRPGSNLHDEPTYEVRPSETIDIASDVRLVCSGVVTTATLRRDDTGPSPQRDTGNKGAPTWGNARRWRLVVVRASGGVGSSSTVATATQWSDGAGPAFIGCWVNACPGTCALRSSCNVRRLL